MIKAAFDPSDHPTNPPRQSASEQQTKANIIPIHGLDIWSVVVGRMARKKAKRRAQQFGTTVKNGVSNMVGGGEIFSAP